MHDHRRHAFSGLLLCGILGCSGTGEPDGVPPDGGGCSDVDGDGYGVGPDCAGPDCNDSDPAIHSEEQCDENCERRDDLAPGCPCEGNEPAICYFGPEGTLGEGICRAGYMLCEEGIWGSCDGQTLPSDEVCDTRDNDCDGDTDEGVLSPCGDCDPDCTDECLGPEEGCAPFDEGSDSATGLVETPEGWLTLDEQPVIRNELIWIANSAQGTVTKIDTATREETGRYYTGRNQSAVDDPSRTAVNRRGDVVVANRGGRGEATRFDASDCPDVDGDGIVETSTGEGDIYPYGEDECLIWATPVGSGARGSAFEERFGLDAALGEWVWVGDYQHFDVHEIDAATGEQTGRVIDDADPYGLAIGPDHTLWTFGLGGGVVVDGVRMGGNLLAVDTESDDLDRELVPIPEDEWWYGITVDREGRVWIGGSVARYDPSLDEWESPDPSVIGGGIAVDEEGNAFTGEPNVEEDWGFGIGGPWKIDAETLDVEALPDVGGHGWAVDFDGFIWSIEPVGSHAYVTDPDTLEHVFTFDRLVGAYTYSDMTGFQLANATNTVGSYSVVLTACDPGDEIQWVHLEWEASIPLDTSLRFGIKTAHTLDQLAVLPLIDLGTVPPGEAPLSIRDALADAGISHRRLLHLEVLLRSSDEDAKPILRELRVTHTCGDVPFD